MSSRFGRFLIGLLAVVTLSLAMPAAGHDYRLRPQQIAPEVYAVIGATEDFDTKNGGNIVNTAFIVGSDGVVVIDSGPSLRYGQQLRQAIAQVTDKPVALVINTHHHPDHFLGNQAFADVAIGALAETRTAIGAEGNAFAENLYRMSGSWMKGTEVLAPNRTLSAGALAVAGRRLRLLAFDGHTGADLAIFDEASGVLFAGDLVFNQRAPTTPHADIAHWLQSLTALEKITGERGFRVLLPGHGQPASDAAPIRQTRAWLQWLAARMNEAARAGLEMNEVLALPLPPQFANMPMAVEEYRRSVGHLFPAAENAALGAAMGAAQ